MNWTIRFESNYECSEGIAEEELLRFLHTWNIALTDPEKKEINNRQRNPFPLSDPLYPKYIPIDPADWSFPQKKLPESYLAFLRYAHGGEFGNGERYFQFFSTADLREMNLAYEIPEYMPDAVSFAMDGSGNHYLWDMRGDMKNGEYPILVAHSGNLGFEDCKQIADTFVELCTGTTSVDEELNG
ncbi:SMI1/KNR4 family protein [Paenibacillus paridis]|uniref:SMI1/KNR4 family protein n=1 Tax=Paenibacillus paridis TaxID=2583376 RepID=UPI00111D169E|nr:SMI1/KNR4 family protein [Paenibacillus paridis]